MRDGRSDPFPLYGTPEWDKMIYENQTMILDWLRSRGHDVEDDPNRAAYDSGHITHPAG